MNVESLPLVVEAKEGAKMGLARQSRTGKQRRIKKT